MSLHIDLAGDGHSVVLACHPLYPLSLQGGLWLQAVSGLTLDDILAEPHPDLTGLTESQKAALRTEQRRAIHSTLVQDIRAIRHTIPSRLKDAMSQARQKARATARESHLPYSEVLDHYRVIMQDAVLADVIAEIHGATTHAVDLAGPDRPKLQEKLREYAETQISKIGAQYAH